MSFSPVPDYSFDRLTDVSAEFLREKGISLLMLDLDNTIAAYGVREADEATLDWVKRVKDSGVTLFIVSNTRKTARVSAYAGALGVDFINDARKPSKRAIEKTMRALGRKPRECALCGDQAYTDVLGGNRAGITSIATRPIRLSNAFLAVRYAMELPFRAMCRNKMGIKLR
ncbi:MAG: YqeG family HAD IIIA-type phosphatase [Oscillospiraceae bacterium]|nr:YqeG family HAD IIIA-type phosphatase [Oscillospiraceae bacterium]